MLQGHCAPLKKLGVDAVILVKHPVKQADAQNPIKRVREALGAHQRIEPRVIKVHSVLSGHIPRIRAGGKLEDTMVTGWIL